MGFSPDGKYFAAGQRGFAITAIGVTKENAALVFDLQARSPLSLKGNVKKLIAGGFAFTAPDRMIAFNPEKPDKSALLGLPGGEIIEEFPMLPGRLAAATKGNYLLVRRFEIGRRGRRPCQTNGDQRKQDAGYRHLRPGLRRRAVDGRAGTLHHRQEPNARRRDLAAKSARTAAAMAVSPDFKWLAVSERSRGAVWNLTKGERAVHMRGFRGGFFSEDGMFYADFPKQENSSASSRPWILAG